MFTMKGLLFSKICHQKTINKLFAKLFHMFISISIRLCCLTSTANSIFLCFLFSLFVCLFVLLGGWGFFWGGGGGLGFFVCGFDLSVFNVM